MVRNCHKCGKEFEPKRNERICCPAVRGKSPLNPKLSFREKQVALLVCKSKLNKDIAYQLHLTEGTIKEFLNRIYKKLGIGNRTALAMWALENGLVVFQKTSSKVITITPEGVAKLG